MKNDDFSQIKFINLSHIKIIKLKNNTPQTNIFHPVRTHIDSVVYKTLVFTAKNQLARIHGQWVMLVSPFFSREIDLTNKKYNIFF